MTIADFHVQSLPLLLLRQMTSWSARKAQLPEFVTFFLGRAEARLAMMLVHAQKSCLHPIPLLLKSLMERRAPCLPPIANSVETGPGFSDFLRAIMFKKLSAGSTHSHSLPCVFSAKQKFSRQQFVASKFVLDLNPEVMFWPCSVSTLCQELPWLPCFAPVAKQGPVCSSCCK